MKFVLLCKRHYTNKDLILDKFGRLFYLPVELAKHGHEGIVIAADYRNKTPFYQRIENIDFYSIPLKPLKLFSFIYQIHRMIKEYQPDILIASGDTHFGALGLWLSHNIKIPMVFDVYDYYPTFGTNKIPFFKSLFKLNLRKADLVICASRPLEKLALTYNPNVIFIPNGIDQTIFKPMDKQSIRKKLQLSQEDKIIGYFGSVEKNRGLETLLAACQLLRSEIPHLKLLFAGKVSIPLSLNETWIDYRGLVSQSQVAELINASDVVTLPYSPSDFITFSNSCKTAEYLACNVPLVSTKVDNYLANYTTILEQSLCNPLDPTDMARALKLQLLNPQTTPFPQELSWSFLGQQLASAITKLLNKSL
jgi:glycosyltransferase involved in cell wall biosynthesis